MRSSTKNQWAFVPLLHALGTAAAVVLAVIATTFLTEFLLCIALSTGPVLVVVRGIGALVFSTAQFTEQAALRAFRSLTEIISSNNVKLIVALLVCVTTTTAAVLTVCTHPVGLYTGVVPL